MRIVYFVVFVVAGASCVHAEKVEIEALRSVIMASTFPQRSMEIEAPNFRSRNTGSALAYQAFNGYSEYEKSPFDKVCMPCCFSSISFPLT